MRNARKSSSLTGQPRAPLVNTNTSQSTTQPACWPLQTTLGNISTARVKPSISLGTCWDLFHVGSWYGGDKVLGFYQFIDGHEWLIKLGWQKNRQEIEDNTTKRKSLFYWVKSEYGRVLTMSISGVRGGGMTLLNIIYSGWRFCWCIYSNGDQGRRKWLFDGELWSRRPQWDLRQWETTFA